MLFRSAHAAKDAGTKARLLSAALVSCGGHRILACAMTKYDQTPIALNSSRA
jgi:hypothetical protein